MKEGNDIYFDETLPLGSLMNEKTNQLIKMPDSFEEWRKQSYEYEKEDLDRT